MAKITVNYNLNEQTTILSESIDLGVVQDEEKTFKLAHHTSGFVQFSGQGVTSGIGENGQIKGIGVNSFPLDSPVRGPAFGLTLRGVETLLTEKSPKNPRINFSFDETSIVPGSATFVLEGHYFPALWRRFVRFGPDGVKYIAVVHPSQAVLSLKVIFPPAEIEHQGFIGLELYSIISESNSTDPFFSMSGATGNGRRNEKGEALGDAIICMFPFPGFQDFADRVPRVLDYQVISVPPKIET